MFLTIILMLIFFGGIGSMRTGCGTFFLLALALAFFEEYKLYIIALSAIIIVLFLTKYVPKKAVEKQKEFEEAELKERERKLNLERRKLELDKQEIYLKTQRDELKKYDDNSWSNF